MSSSSLRNTVTLVIIFPLLLASRPIDSVEQNSSDLTPISVENVIQLKSLHSASLPPINQLAWSRDEKHLGVATDDGIWLYNVTDGSTERVGEDLIAEDVSFLGDTTQIAVDYIDRAAIFDMNTLNSVRELPRRFNAINHKGDLYATIESDAVYLFSTLNDEQKGQIPINTLQPCDYACVIQDIVFSLDDNYIVLSSAVPEVENAIVNITTGKRLSTIELGMLGLAFNFDGSIIASRAGEPGYLSRSVEFTDSETGKLIATIKISGTYSAPAFSSDNRLIAIAGLDNQAPNPEEAAGKLYFFDLDNVRKITNGDASLAIRTDTFDTWITTTQFSPSSRYLAIGDKSGHLYIWGIA
jgi:WD40 repeat protein